MWKNEQTKEEGLGMFMAFRQKTAEWMKLDAEERRKLALNKGGSTAWKLVRMVLLLCMSFVVLYPILYMISTSLRESIDMYDPTVIWIPRHWTMKNYAAVIETLNFWPLLLDTVTLSLFSAVLNVAVCAVAGYGFARFKFRLRNLAFACVLATIIIPPQNVSIPMYMQYAEFDFLGIGSLVGLCTGEKLTLSLLDTDLTIYLPALLGQGLRSGLFIYIFRQFFRGMPKELEDAAYIDGCGIFRTFCRIMLPNAGSSVLTCFLFSFVWYWNDYYTMSMYFNEAKTLSVALAMLKDVLRGQGLDVYVDPYSVVTQVQAACLLTILPLLLIYVFFQRYFRESIERSGLVG